MSEEDELCERVQIQRTIFFGSLGLAGIFDPIPQISIFFGSDADIHMQIHFMPQTLIDKR
jgi:hypothetical protein